MKKLIATFLLLSIATPCMAMNGYYNPPVRRSVTYYAPAPAPHHYNQPVVVEHHYTRRPHRASTTTKTFATIAGIAGVAMIISAIVD